MIVYAKFNHARKPEYQLLTTIEKRGSIIKARKQAATLESKAFLESIFSSYRNLSSYSWPFELSEPRKEDDSIVFDFAEGKSLDTVLFEATLSKDRIKLKKVFENYKNLLAKIKTVEIKPGKEFENYFGKGDVREACLQTGLLDLILENIFEGDSGKFQVIDYEWSFPFPIPLKYLYFRAITNSYFKYAAYNVAEVLPIKDVFEFFSIGKEESKRFLRYDYNFLSRVHKPEEMVAFEKFSTGFKYLGRRSQSSNYIKFLEEEKAKLEREVSLQKEQLEKAGQIEEELNSIKFSRTWKMRERIVKYRRKNG